MMRDTYSLLPSLPCGDRVRSLLRRCLDFELDARPSARQVAEAISETGEHALTPSRPRPDSPTGWALGLLLDRPRSLILVRRPRLLVYRGLHFSLSQPAFDEAGRAVSAIESGAPAAAPAIGELLAEIDGLRARELGDALTERGLDPLTAEMCIVIE